MTQNSETKNGPGNIEGKERWVGLASRALLFWAEHLIRIKIQGEENLKEAGNYVNNNQGGLLVTPNHSSYIDAMFMSQVRKEVGPQKRFVVLWANKFTGKDQGKYSETG